MSSGSSHPNFLFYFEKMLLNACRPNERDKRSRQAEMSSPSVLGGRLLRSPPLIGPEISPPRADPVEAPKRGLKRR